MVQEPTYGSGEEWATQGGTKNRSSRYSELSKYAGNARSIRSYPRSAGASLVSVHVVRVSLSESGWAIESGPPGARIQAVLHSIILAWGRSSFDARAAPGAADRSGQGVGGALARKAANPYDQENGAVKNQGGGDTDSSSREA